MKRTRTPAAAIAVGVVVLLFAWVRGEDGRLRPALTSPAWAGCKKFDLKCKAREAKKAVERKAQEAKKAAERKAQEAKKAAERKAQQATAAASKLANVVEQVWSSLRPKILKPVADLFKSAIAKAKGAMSALINKAKASMGGVLQAQVVVPALVWAIEGLLPGGAAGLAKVRVLVERLLGQAEKVAARQAEMAAVLQTLQAGDAAGYRAALARFERGLTEWTNIGLKDIVEGFIANLRGKLAELVKGRTIDLLAKGFKLLEQPIEAGKKAALAAISAIPGAGGMLRGAADVILTQGLGLLRTMAFEMVGLKAVELASKALTNLTPHLVKGASALDAKLKPIVNKIRPHLDAALKQAQGVRAEWFKLRDKLREAGKTLGKTALLGGDGASRALAAATHGGRP